MKQSPGMTPLRRPGGLDDLVPPRHPLRRIRNLTDTSLGSLYGWLRVSICRPHCPVAPAPLVRAFVLQLLYSIDNDRELIDRIWRSLLFRWFVGIDASESRWDINDYRAHRQRLLDHELARESVARVFAAADREGLLEPLCRSMTYHEDEGEELFVQWLENEIGEHEGSSAGPTSAVIDFQAAATSNRETRLEPRPPESAETARIAGGRRNTGRTPRIGHIDARHSPTIPPMAK